MTVRESERGSVLIVVLVAIVILLPLTLLMTSLSLSWQKDSIRFRESISQEYAVQAGLAEAAQRLSAGEIELRVEESTTVEIDSGEDIARHPPNVRITRLPDVAVSVQGSVLTEFPPDLDFEQTGVDSDGRLFFRFRRLEIYLVESLVAVGPGRSGVRLHGVLGRVDGEVKLLGMDSGRGFFGSGDR